MKLLTEEEAAELLRIKIHTLKKIRYEHAKMGTPLPSLGIGGSIRYFEDDLIAWARKQLSPYSSKSKKTKQENLEETEIVTLR